MMIAVKLCECLADNDHRNLVVVVKNEVLLTKAAKKLTKN